MVRRRKGKQNYRSGDFTTLNSTVRGGFNEKETFEKTYEQLSGYGEGHSRKKEESLQKSKVVAIVLKDKMDKNDTTWKFFYLQRENMLLPHLKNTRKPS